MHEFSLVRELLLQVEAIREQNGAANVTSIHIEIGPLSGVEPTLVEEAFHTLVAETDFSNTRLAMEFCPLMANCLQCHGEFEVANFHFVCPVCFSSRVQITSGDQLRLESIVLALDDSPIASWGAPMK